MNNKSVEERLQSIRNEGPDKWLSRSLFKEEDAEDKARADVAKILGKRLGGQQQRFVGDRFKPPGRATPAMADAIQDIKDQGLMQRVADTEPENTGNSAAARAQRASARDAAERAGITRGGRPAILSPRPRRFRNVGVEGEPVPDFEGGRPAGRRRGAATPQRRDLPPMPDMNPEILDELQVDGNEVNLPVSPNRVGTAGGSPDKNRGENASVEALWAMHQQGMHHSSDELKGLLSRHFSQRDDGSNWTDEQVNSKVESAIKTAQLMLNHFDNGAPKPINVGVDNGAYHDVPDENRTQLYDDILDILYKAVGQRYTSANPRAGRRDWNEAEITTEGRKQLAALVTGKEALQPKGPGQQSEGISADFKAIVSPHDVYLSNAETENRTREDFQLLADAYADSADDNPEIADSQFLKSFLSLLSTKGRNRDLMGYSLKELQDGNNGKIAERNQMPGELNQILNSIITGDVNFPTVMNQSRGQNPRLKLNRGFTFDTLTQLLDTLGEQEDIAARFSSSTARRPSKFKVEPQGDGAMMGETPIHITSELIRRFTGEERDDNINFVRGEGGADNPRAVLENAEAYSPEQIQYWKDFVQDLVDNPSERFNLGKQDFILNNQQTSPQDWIGGLLGLHNGGDAPEGTNFDTIEGRMDVLSMLRNLRMFKALRNADNDTENNGLQEILSLIIGGSGRYNTREEDYFAPHAKIANKV